MRSFFILTVILAALPVAAAQEFRASSRLAEQLADIVSVRLARSGTLKASSIAVSSSSGVITLKGTVPSESARRRAVQMASRVRGVERVEDQLRVAPAPVAANSRDDTELARTVAETLVRDVLAGNGRTQKDWIYGWEVNGSNFEFDVEVDDGDVTLDGEAPSPAVATQLVRVTRNIPGVRSVHSMLYIDRYGHGRFSSPLGYPEVPYYYWPY